ncbi:universal stress protein [Ferribacterium limneticum]|uniref:universal stress protein n=1 Tax=Ferribacterium limneticum TaxID=76259 RepID=UPI001CFC429C|nr:universal stress protein [Ferribacterium limneticum]UCV17749.1 universal stress protein [Ferribacterium limneticum]
MYRHLMVPVDGSTLSALNVESAIKLARKLESEITFLYATPDLASTADGLIIRSSDPNLFESEALGETNAILKRAASSAHAAGVNGVLLSRISVNPAQTIVQEATLNGCDLIVMATRGRRGLTGWINNSQTEKVIRQSPIPVLITRIEANNPMTDMERAIAVIQEEHRSIAAVVRGMLNVSRDYREHGNKIDLKPLSAMLTYLHKFPTKMHHPKEEKFIHAALRLRAPECLALLDELESQHKKEHLFIDQVEKSLSVALSGENAHHFNLSSAIEVFADAVWGHMGKEEREVLPLAQTKLLPSDWAKIAEAFDNNEDPSFGQMDADEFRNYFRRIADLMPDEKR